MIRKSFMFCLIMALSTVINSKIVIMDSEDLLKALTTNSNFLETKNGKNFIKRGLTEETPSEEDEEVVIDEEGEGDEEEAAIVEEDAEEGEGDDEEIGFEEDAAAIPEPVDESEEVISEEFMEPEGNSCPANFDALLADVKLIEEKIIAASACAEKEVIVPVEPEVPTCPVVPEVDPCFVDLNALQLAIDKETEKVNAEYIVQLEEQEKWGDDIKVLKEKLIKFVF